MITETIMPIVKKETIQSMQETLKVLQRGWTRRNLAVEIATLEGNRTIFDPEERKLRDYAISTTNRRKFCLYNIRAFYDNESISYKQLIKLLNISRNALDTMINECVGAKWVIFTEGKTKNDGKFTAANITIKAYENYANWSWQVWENTGTFMQSQSIIELQHLIKHAECEKAK
tara:strand:- start:3588 stop:4109 length:522 start_codon:yes stop_codon:yes gene_type:complete